MNSVTKKILEKVADLLGEPKGAYNIREDGQCAGRQSTQNVEIISKTDRPGIDIRVAPYAKETVYIPACVTRSDVDDLVYNDFFIGEGADIEIVAGCGVHTDGEEESRHNGVHRFFVGKLARVRYVEKHIGFGAGEGRRVINPQTQIDIAQDGYMEMETTQIGGVDYTRRITGAVLREGAKLIIREKLLTEGEQEAHTDFQVALNGDESGADLISRSVAKGHSKQMFVSRIDGNAACMGHSECDAIIMDEGKVSAQPALNANHIDAALIHEAAIGKIAGEQLVKLMTLGLSEEEAVSKIIEGFLK